VCPTLGWDASVPVPPQIEAVRNRFGLTWDDAKAQARTLYEAGVRLVSGGDSGINPAKRHGVLPQAVAELASLGVPAGEALASATGRAADACGLGARTGRLRPGLCADLLLLDGNPLVDIEALRAVRTVVARGREVAPPGQAGGGRPPVMR
jgi:imidazolonepropionase-like amidohydrolase